MSKPFIVVTEIFFSVIGVLIGYALTGMTIATIMVLVGVVGLAGIVIKNGILLIEFTDELRGRGMRTREAAIQAGKIRIIPVMLTAVATILGLLPLAVGFNIDFAGLFQHLRPNIFFGGDSVVFLGSAELDDHLRTYLLLLPYTDDGAQHVPDRRKVEKTDGESFMGQGSLRSLVLQVHSSSFLSASCIWYGECRVKKSGWEN